MGGTMTVAELHAKVYGDCPGPVPFMTVPCCELHEIAETLNLALAHPDWRGLANACGIAAEDMWRFLRGEAMLTAPMRERIREAVR